MPSEILSSAASQWPAKKPTPATRTLDELPQGSHARIAGFLGIEGGVADRLVEMGFDEGAEVETLHVAPLGDPIAVRVDGTSVALRRAIAACILIEDLA